MKIYIPQGYVAEYERREQERLQNKNRLFDPWMDPTAKNLLRLYIIGKLIIFYRKILDFLSRLK